MNVAMRACRGRGSRGLHALINVPSPVLHPPARMIANYCMLRLPDGNVIWSVDATAAEPAAAPASSGPAGRTRPRRLGRATALQRTRSPTFRRCRWEDLAPWPHTAWMQCLRTARCSEDSGVGFHCRFASPMTSVGDEGRCNGSFYSQLVLVPRSRGRLGPQQIQRRRWRQPLEQAALFPRVRLPLAYPPGLSTPKWPQYHHSDAWMLAGTVGEVTAHPQSACD